MITCVGIGPGSLAYLTNKSMELIQKADVVAGFDSVLNLIAPIINKNAQVISMTYRSQVQQLDKVAKLHHQGSNCVVAFMGDIHFSGFQFLERVERACGHEVETIPGISSAQILASKAKVCFDETTFITFHRRGDLTPFKTHLVSVLKDGRNAIIIPHPPDLMPREVASYLLLESISPNHIVEVWENLTLAEADWRGTLSNLAKEEKSFSDMSIILIRTLHPLPRLQESLV